jgi:hypothetical protein
MSLASPSWIGINAENAEKLGGQSPSYYGKEEDLGKLTNLLTKEKSNLVNAINEIKQQIMRGASTFNGNTGTVINHSIGHLNYSVSVTPTGNPNGYLGEVWVEKSINSFKVYCSGTAKTSFDFTLIS